MKRSADISDCGHYRWWLRRRWAPGPLVCFVMLNPSIADAERDDATIRRCISFARAWGYGALSVRNLFPWIATDPRELGKASLQGHDITGGERGTGELAVAVTADLVVAAWGANRLWSFGAAKFLHVTKEKPIWCIGLTKQGHPVHPLRQRADLLPRAYRRCEGCTWRAEELPT